MNLRTRSLAILLLLTAACHPGAHPGVAMSPASPELWAGLRPGSYHIGYRRLEPSGGTVHVWYPATTNGTPLKFRDYLGADTTALASFLKGAKVGSVTIDSLFASSLFAARSARAATGRRSLVLVAQGNANDAIDQVVLCEYLASQGFVVATTPSPMRKSPMEREDQAGTFAEQQANDLAAAIDVVKRELPGVSERVGIVGESFGARSALLLAMRDSRIKAIVSLDGGIGTATALEPFRSARSFRPDAALPPTLHFYEELDSFMKPDFSLLKSLNFSSLTLERTEALHHIHFTTYGFAASVFPEIASVTSAMPATRLSVIGVAAQTADFLRQYLTTSPMH